MRKARLMATVLAAVVSSTSVMPVYAHSNVEPISNITVESRVYENSTEFSRHEDFML